MILVVINCNSSNEIKKIPGLEVMLHKYYLLVWLLHNGNKQTMNQIVLKNNDPLNSWHSFLWKIVNLVHV